MRLLREVSWWQIVASDFADSHNSPSKIQEFRARRSRLKAILRFHPVTGAPFPVFRNAK
ncbi:hypothetical protein RRSWK_04416 [Rhodopirellula sp. SWK7]|nr:hypothetical protein RRSWK_04416 [Rhodopirellula sp. SWK7]